MKKALLLLICGILISTLCACGASSIAERYAEQCWNVIGDDNITVDEVYIMKYTSRRNLTGEVLDTPMYEEIPQQGYAILFHSYLSREPFGDSFACFLDDKGNLMFSFDYEENYALYEKYYGKFSIYNIEAGENAVEYLTNCNYISSMINDADDGELLQGNLDNNIWYSFSDKQIKTCVN